MSGTLGTEYSHKLFCKVADIVESDVIAIGGKNYQVQSVNNPDLMNHHLELDLKQLVK